MATDADSALQRLDDALSAPETAERQAGINDALNHILRLADQYNAVGRADAAASLLERIAPLTPDVPRRRSLGLTRFIQGRDDDARRDGPAADDGAVVANGLREALDAAQEYRRRCDVVGTIVIPARNAENWIAATLDSVADSIGYYRRRTGQADAAFCIVVVDDASTDRTADRVGEWMGRNDAAQTLLIRNSVNRGAGYSRNLGARAGAGRYLWFLDSDDIFFEPHLFVGAWGLDNLPQAGFVRSGMLFEGIDDQVTAAWRAASESTYPCNICIRVECHNLVRGFPEERPFCPYGPEDVGYSRFIGAMFLSAHTPEKTVQYSIREGNVGHSLKERLQGRGERLAAPPGAFNAKDIAVELFIRRRLHGLSARIGDPGWRGPPLLPDGAPRYIRFTAPLS